MVPKVGLMRIVKTLSVNGATDDEREITMKVLTGSSALRHYLPDMREPKDVDYLSDEPILKGEDTFTHPAIGNYAWSGEVASLDELYTIKISHSFWVLKNGSWDKHIYDIMKMKDLGAKFIPELYTILYPVWEENYGKKKISLELSPDKFFNPHVNRKYDHDSIHASVAYYDEPLFNQILRDSHEVAVDRSKFEALPLEDKLKLVREEVYATALERRLIPVDYKMNRRVAYSYAMRKTITDFTKGWFPLFILENFTELRKPDLNFVELHKANADKLILL